MAIRSGFFQSIGGDRRYRAEFFASYFASFIGNGVFPNPSTNLQVVSSINMNVNVSAGKGWINGYYLVNDSNFTITIPTADGVLNRIDRIVFALDFNTREMNIYNKRGTPSANPTAPALVRNSNVYELALADISIPAGTTFISQALITDQRLNTNLCGVVVGLVNQVDTSTLFIQYQTEFNDFLESIQDVLSGDVAGNLLNLINDLDSRFTTHAALTSTTARVGHVRLNNATNSTSTTTAATANAVRLAYERAEAAFQSAGNGKVLIANAITGKGQTVSSNDTFAQLANAINAISTGAAISNVYSGVADKASDGNGDLTINLPTTIDVSKSILLYTYSLRINTNTANGVGAELRSTDILFRYGQSSPTASYRVGYFVVEFSAGINVQHLAITANGTSSNRTITAVDPDRTFLLANTTGINGNAWVASLTSATNVQITRLNDTTSSNTARVQVVSLL